MIARMFVLTVLIYVHSSQASKMDYTPTINSEQYVRVRLKRQVNDLNVSGINLKWSEYKNNMIVSSSKLAGENIKLEQIKVQMSVEKQGLNEVVNPKINLISKYSSKNFIESDNKSQIHLPVKSNLENKLFNYSINLNETDAAIYIFGDSLLVNGILAPSPIKILKNDLRGFDVIVELPIENYLKGVLPAEMPISWPIEVLKAQAVASRSYLVSNMLRRGANQNFDVESSVMDQVYNFESEIMLNTEHNSKLNQAIKETEGQVLVNIQNENITRGYFHSDCGGVTESSQNVWGSGDKSQKVVLCPRKNLSNWSVNYSWNELNNRIKPELNIKENLIDLNFDLKSESGRVKSVSLIFEDRKMSVNSNIFRRILGFNKLKSTFFSVEKNEEGIKFKGRGHGHGVGMCQWGARELAKQGQNYQDILKYYFPNSKISTNFLNSKITHLNIENLNEDKGSEESKTL